MKTQKLKTKKNIKIEIGRGYAWELEGGILCWWAEPNMAQLLARTGKPSPEAKVRRIIIVKEADWRRFRQRGGD